MKKPIHKIWWFWILLFLIWAFINSRLPIEPELITILYLLGIPILILLFIQIGKMQERRSKEKFLKINNAFECYHVMGIDHIPEGEKILVYVKEDQFIAEYNNNKFKLPFSKIKASKAVTKSEVIREEKSVIGRGIVGGVIFGPLGAIIGGMSGVGDKAKTGKYLIINYVGKDENLNIIGFNLFDFKKATALATALTNYNISQNISKDGTFEI